MLGDVIGANGAGHLASSNCMWNICFGADVSCSLSAVLSSTDVDAYGRSCGAGTAGGTGLAVALTALCFCCCCLQTRQRRAAQHPS